MQHLAEFVASAVHTCTDELAALVRQQVDAELNRLVDELVAVELEARGRTGRAQRSKTLAEV